MVPKNDSADDALVLVGLPRWQFLANISLNCIIIAVDNVPEAAVGESQVVLACKWLWCDSYQLEHQIMVDKFAL